MKQKFPLRFDGESSLLFQFERVRTTGSIWPSELPVSLVQLTVSVVLLVFCWLAIIAARYRPVPLFAMHDFFRSKSILKLLAKNYY